MVWALFGWGAWFERLVVRSDRPVPTARAAVGLAVVLAMGGVLNLLHLLVGPVYLALLIGGMLGGVLHVVLQIKASLGRLSCRG